MTIQRAKEIGNPLPPHELSLFDQQQGLKNLTNPKCCWFILLHDPDNHVEIQLTNLQVFDGLSMRGSVLEANEAENVYG